MAKSLLILFSSFSFLLLISFSFKSCCLSCSILLLRVNLDISLVSECLWEIFKCCSSVGGTIKLTHQSYCQVEREVTFRSQIYPYRLNPYQLGHVLCFLPFYRFYKGTVILSFAYKLSLTLIYSFWLDPECFFGVSKYPFM